MQVRNLNNDGLTFQKKFFALAENLKLVQAFKDCIISYDIRFQPEYMGDMGQIVVYYHGRQENVFCIYPDYEGKNIHSITLRDYDNKQLFKYLKTNTRLFGLNVIDVNYEGDYVDVYVEDKETVLNYSSNGHALLNVEGSFVESVIINEGVKSIGDKAFANCFYLKSITIPSSVEEIGEGAFENCYSLEEIILPPNLKQISNDCFANCVNLSKVTFNSSLETIGSKAFYRCEKIKTIDLPNSLKILGDNAFAFSGLEKITILSRLAKVGELVFLGCSSLLDICVLPEYYLFNSCQLVDTDMEKGMFLHFENNKYDKHIKFVENHLRKI